MQELKHDDHIYVKVTRCGKPDRWYRDQIGKTFVTILSAFGYRVAFGDDRGKVIFLDDAIEVKPPQKHEKAHVSRFPSTEEHLRERELKRAQRASTGLKMNHTYDPEIERQIQEYALMKKRSRSG